MSKLSDWSDDKKVITRLTLENRILKEKTKNDDDYIGDLEQDNYRLIDMVTELRKTVKEIGGEDLYKHLYPVENESNQMDLFEDK